KKITQCSEISYDKNFIVELISQINRSEKIFDDQELESNNIILSKEFDQSAQKSHSSAPQDSDGSTTMIKYGQEGLESQKTLENLVRKVQEIEKGIDGFIFRTYRLKTNRVYKNILDRI